MPSGGIYMEEMNGIARQLRSIGRVLVLIFIVLAFFAVVRGIEIYEDYREEKRIEELNEFRYVSEPDAEISDAKNTTYNDGLVSTMISSIDRNASWHYFFSDNGREVVEVNGEFNRSKLGEAISIIEDNVFYVDPEYGEFRELTSVDANGDRIFDEDMIDSVKFRIQFVKHLDDSLKNNVYDKYYLGYSEIVIVPRNGRNEITEVVGDSILSIMDSYIRKVIWGN